MSNFKQMAEQAKERVKSVTHTLIIGQTKSGKSDWVAQCAIDGWEVMYVDNDNGISTLMALLADNPEAASRIHYFNPENMFDFCTTFFSSSVIRYGETQRKSVSSASVKDDEMIDEIYPARIGPNVILAIDSWTSVTNSIIHDIAQKRGFDLIEADKFTREIYGPSGFKLNELLFQIQNAPFHVIVQAHPAYYERKEKPGGQRAENISEKDMIIRETTAIPLSSSMPHGYTMGKYFTHTGWMSVTGLERRDLDFRVKKDVISGGNFPPNTKLNGDPRTDMRFSKLFGKPPVVEPTDKPWIRRLTGAEFKAEKQMRDSKAPSSPAMLTGGKVTQASPAPANALDKLKGLSTNK